MEKELYDCSYAMIDASAFYKDDLNGLRAYRKSMRDKGLVLRDGHWVVKESIKGEYD